METTAVRGISIPVSRVGLGTWAIGGWMWGGADDPAAVATIQNAIARGINLIDTAPVYGFGHSEELVGKALAGVRSEVVIATKAGLSWDNQGRIVRDSRPGRIRAEVEASLRRLRTDYIDIYQIHWPDYFVPVEEVAAELERLRQEGKIRAIGVSNFTPEQMDSFSSVAQLSTVQPPYNLFEREIEDDVLPYAIGDDLQILAYGALCRGLLSGRMSLATTFDGDDIRRADPKFASPRFSQYLAAVDALNTFARERHGKSVLALAIRWVLDQGPTIALWGARRPDQIAGLEDAFGWSLSQGDLREIEAILTHHVQDPVGPEFMAPPLRGLQS